MRSTALLAAVWSVVLSGPLEGSPESKRLRDKASELEYNLDYEEAMAAFRQAAAADPADAAAYRGVATAVWLHLQFLRGTVTVDDYLGRVSKPIMSMRQPPPDMAAAFRTNVERALALSEKQLAAMPRSADAYYQVGAAVGLQASYAATVEGRVLGGFRAARRAYEAHEKCLELDPSRKDAGLVVGTYRYIVATLTLPMRWMAYAAGFGGGREKGIRLIEEAAAYPGESQTDARLALILIYNREKRYDAALRLLHQLIQRYPRNRLFWLEAGSTALRAGRFAEAERILDEGFSKLAHDRRRRMYGEEALWRYKRGAARVALRRLGAAEQDLQAAVAGEARDWIKGRARTELGKVADLAGNAARAKVEYQTAIRLAEADNDPLGEAEARRLVRDGYR